MLHKIKGTHPSSNIYTMATSDVKVLGVGASPFVNRVVMALKLKSVEYELVELNPHEKPELLVKSNPVHKKIPVLIHADKIICESLVIVQYIDDAWPNGPSILPSDPYDRAIARFWAAYIDDKLLPLLKQLGQIKEDEEARKAVMEKISEGLILLEEAFISCGKGKAFFGGDDVGYVDLALGCHVGWIKVTEKMTGVKLLDETNTPRLLKWADRLYSDSAVKDVMMETDTLLELLKKFKAMSSSTASN